jgi:crotonobetainyl-CoA:carnitine CoA-transferase CaiB-like acyl-CoA transferase
MRAWLGEPPEFADPAYDPFQRRLQAADRLYPLIERLLRDRSAMDLVAEGQRRGIPIAPVLTPGEALEAAHFASRRFFVELPVGESIGRAPSGHVVIDGERAGIRAPAPPPGRHTGHVVWDARRASGGNPAVERRPLEGVRVLDLGVIVMGGEAGRLFADQGADVIKVENRHFPDGARAARMTPFFAAAHRNKRAIGVDLRDPEGLAVFERLVERADVVLSNFKPGTLETLGIAPERLREINPRVVVVTSSAMGESGPWRDWMGYGPLVRCVSGLTHLWCDPDVPDGFADGTTIFPDHFAARVVDAAALAALIRRRITGEGAHIESAQVESIITALGPQFLRESLEPGALAPLLHGDADAPWGVYRCEGQDQWCVVTVRSDDEWSALVGVLGTPAWASAPELASREGRLAARKTIDDHLAAWTSTRSPRDVATALQSAGVPAGMMERVSDLLDDPQLAHRGFFRRLQQPDLRREVVVENGPCLAERLPAPPMEPAPLYGQHTRSVCREILGMSDTEIDDLVARGVLDEATDRGAARRG